MLTAQSRGISSHHSTDPTYCHRHQSRPASASSLKHAFPLSPLPKLAPPTPDRSRCHEHQTAVPPHFHLFPIPNTNLAHAYRAASPSSAICYIISPGAWPRTDRASISGVRDSPSAMAAMTPSEQAHPHSNRVIYPRARALILSRCSQLTQVRPGKTGKRGRWPTRPLLVLVTDSD
jgi:hypothetical protein